MHLVWEEMQSERWCAHAVGFVLKGCSEMTAVTSPTLLVTSEHFTFLLFNSVQR